jgi:hypothetical protein
VTDHGLGERESATADHAGPAGGQRRVLPAASLAAELRLPHPVEIRERRVAHQAPCDRSEHDGTVLSRNGSRSRNRSAGAPNHLFQAAGVRPYPALVWRTDSATLSRLASSRKGEAPSELSQEGLESGTFIRMPSSRSLSWSTPRTIAVPLRQILRSTRPGVSRFSRSDPAGRPTTSTLRRAAAC